MKKLFLILTLILSSSVHCQIESYHSKLEKITCETCHGCKNPTKEDPCLLNCPREKMELQYMTADRSPKLIELKTLSEKDNKYGKVEFSHRAHAEMSNLAGGCVMCHHFNAPGEVQNCSECHSPERKRENINLPDLKGAFHRLCIDCHKKWSGSTDCETCHKENTKGKPAGMEMTERIHPKVAIPEKKEYKTGLDDMPVVDFYHFDHINLYGFECKDCHSDESCVKCHAAKSVQKTLTLKSEDDPHGKCSKCHDTDENCENCHSANGKEPFNHKTKTGFDLSKFHSKLSCSKCHKTPGKFSGMNSSCTGCHSDWNSETFDHKKTGLELNEIHSELECENCHLERNFKKKPVCTECHDEISYPGSLPGKRVN